MYIRLLVILNNHEDMKQAMVKQSDDFSHRPSFGKMESMSPDGIQFLSFISICH